MTVTIDTVPGVPIEPPGVGSGAEPVALGGRPSAAGNWVINVRNADLDLVGEVEDYQLVDLLPRYNDIGTWVLDVDVDANPTLADELLAPGAGIVAVRGDRTIISGPARRWELTKNADEHRLIVGGFSDEYWLGARVVSPEPATSSPPYATSAYDVRSGVASTILAEYVDVNAGPSAIAPRRVRGLTIGGDPLVGGTVNGRGRWQQLLALLQDLATAAGIGFRVLQSGGELLFQTFEPVDHTDDVVLSAELGTLAAHRLTLEIPETDYVYVGGGGEETARVIREIADNDVVAQYWRTEAFRDARDTTDTTELDQRGAEHLADHAAKYTIEATPADQSQLAYLTHYDLGDQITTVVNDVAYTEVVRAARITFTPDDDGAVKVTVGTPGPTTALRILAAQRRLARQIRNLERR